MTKNIHILVLLLFVWLQPIVAQEQIKIYNIKGEELKLSENTETLIIVYGSISCHACMESLAKFVSKWSQHKTNRKVYVLLRGDDPMGMRLETSSVKDFFPAGFVPEIVYDFNPDTSQRFETIFQFSRFPAILYYSKNNTPTFYSYELLFGQAKPANLRKLFGR